MGKRVVGKEICFRISISSLGSCCSPHKKDLDCPDTRFAARGIVGPGAIVELIADLHVVNILCDNLIPIILAQVFPAQAGSKGIFIDPINDDVNPENQVIGPVVVCQTTRHVDGVAGYAADFKKIRAAQIMRDQDAEPFASGVQVDIHGI